MKHHLRLQVADTGEPGPIACLCLFLIPMSSRVVVSIMTASILGWGRSWPTIIAFCVVAAAVQELVVASLHVTRTFQPIMFAIGFAAALVWAFAALGVRKLVARSKPTRRNSGRSRSASRRPVGTTGLRNFAKCTVCSP